MRVVGGCALPRSIVMKRLALIAVLTGGVVLTVARISAIPVEDAP